MASYLMNPQERTRFFRFAVVGVIGAVVDFGTMNLLAGVFAASLIFAGTISFIAAILSNFTWNRYWTYPDSRSKPMMAQLGLFAAINLVGLFIRVLILQFGSVPLGDLTHSLIHSINPATAAGLGANEAWLIAVVIVMFWNFFVNRYWTYNDVK